MRKPRDFDSEMKALNERAKLLKERKLHQIGELVIAAGADMLAVEVLVGAMLAAVDTKDTATLEVWRKRHCLLSIGKPERRAPQSRRRARRSGGRRRRETDFWRRERDLTRGHGR